MFGVRSARTKLLTPLLLAAALCIAFVGAGTAVRAGVPARQIAQLVLPTGAPSGSSSAIVVNGVYVTAPIVLDGVPLFRIATPVNAPITQLPIATRVANVQAVIDQLLSDSGSGPQTATTYEPKSLRIHSRREADVAVLSATDAKHASPLAIITVTAVDARANSSDVDSLAAEWQDTLQTALVHALELRQPALEQRNLQHVIHLAIVLTAISVPVVLFARALWRRSAALERQLNAAGDSLPEESQSPEASTANAQRRRSFARRLRMLEPAARLRIYSAVAESLLWTLVLAWFIGATWSLSLFAETTPLARTIARNAIGVAATIIAAGLLNRLLDAVIARAAAAWRLRTYANSDERARLLLRIPTISRAVAGAKTFGLVFLAALSVLGQAGVPIGSVVTIGGLAAIALSLAAQNFVRDFLNGFLVLFEDQYVVGDYVTINTYSGLVERLTLRMVQIRDAAGDVITVPHSSVVNVVNGSRNWSRVDYRIPVDPGADLPQAITIVREQIAALAAEDDWTSSAGETLEWIGIDGLSRDAAVVRASIRTAPLRQFDVRRRINERVSAAFHAAGIALGAPPPP